ncbi:hypothetical protein KEM54_005871 [Ascosphaera aggregata]|nr:hypothetical protein KEM54_005871 [Ascosphaera aggregata]
MFSRIFTHVLLGASFISSALAQSFTDCQPLNKTCPANPALSGNYTINFNKTVDSVLFVTQSGQLQKNTKDGGSDFVIGHKGEGPTIRSQFYLFFGRVEVVMRAAKGAGIISCIVLMSDDLDEIDWEFIGSKTDTVETDYFGKGNDTLSDRELTVDIPNAMDEFHNLTVDWTKERIEWWVDDKLTRTLRYEEALGGKNYPQTPARVSVGMWSAGDSKREGTVTWAGGKTDYSKGPFVMTVKSLYVEDYSKGKEYVYGDRSGDWESIEIVEGKAFYAEQIKKGPPKSTSERWSDLPKGAKAGIFVALAAVCSAAIAGLAICCVIQRKRGKEEYTLAQTAYTSQIEASEKLRSEWLRKQGGGGGYMPINKGTAS